MGRQDERLPHSDDDSALMRKGIGEVECLQNERREVCLIRCPAHAAHDYPAHPETGRRIDHIWEALREGPMLSEVQLLDARRLSEDDVGLVHEPQYVQWLRDLSPTDLLWLDGDTYIGPATYEAALWSAGCAVRGLEALMQGEARRAFALCRPPGHHAFADRAMGFCFFNNVALAARMALSRFGLTRVAIVDWDVHHGNGTQAIFYEDPAVLFVSMHQHPAYPGTGLAHEVGHGKGRGFTVNIPLSAGCTDDHYLAAMQEKVAPVLDVYRPELIIVSAGQDGLLEDPLGAMNLTPSGYGLMTQALMDLADRHAAGRLLLCLEGGYHLAQQAQAVRAIMERLLRQ